MKRAFGLFVLMIAACGAPAKPIVAARKPIAKVAPTVSASSSASAAPTLDPHFREHEPALGPPESFTMPQVHESKLANGVRLLSANTGGGIFAMRVSFEGFAAFPTERAAAARLMVKSMFGGTPTEDAHALRRVLEKRFATWSTDTEPDSVSIEMWMPADDMRAVVDTLGDVIMHPQFDQITLGFELLQLVEQGQTAKESPDTLAYRAFMRGVYGDNHPYAKPSTVLDGNANIDHAEAQRIYEELTDPATTTVSLAGAVDAPTLNHVQRVFANWRGVAHAHSTALAPITWRTGPRVIVVDRPGSVQSEIKFGGLAPARSSHDWFAMQVVHEILGAHRSSRISRALVDPGATHNEMHRREGTFYWSSSVPLDRTASVLAEIDKQFTDLGQTAPSASELDEKKALYLRRMPILLETARAKAELISHISTYALPVDTFSTLTASINAVTADDVKNVAHATLAPDHTRAIVVGDWSKLKTSLKALGWGPIEIRDGTGKLLRTEK